jgi:leucine dehydrogenase
MFELLSQYRSMELHVFSDEATGLRAAVAIHSTQLGPAIGGTRVYPYATEDQAILDVTRLARAMTFKAAISRLPHGGGKSIIWIDPSRPLADRAAAFRAFGRFVDGLGGRYLASEDSGTSPADLDVIRSVTPHCLGASPEAGGSGDPSPFTALGVRRGIEACANVILGRSDLQGLHVAVQGVGHVGSNLVRELTEAGANVTIADIDPARAAAVARTYGASIVDVVDVEAIFDVACDIFAPCALGGAISDATIDRLRCGVVAGAANNQLASPEIGRVLAARNIFYAPDYAINAGGLINVAQEHAGYDAEASRAKTLAIYDTITEIATRSRRTGVASSEIADKLVEEILAEAAAAQPAAASTAAILSSPASSRGRETAV